ncbi:cyclic nucleotide-binding domain-containing protein [Oceaniglobus roseus]|uniref:cyclic nucleotide-binding domain-containing protein n=1 Tax=Oceaniglobus roseus TaxID=1737570 RepID=UPI001561F093|nr:cyclic nucleotide-binding domain-containing protein [Kandeliimicrobium roseum]
MKDEVQILKAVPLFARMPVQKLRMLAFTSERVHFAPGDPIAREGEMSSVAYVILCGEAEVSAPAGVGSTVSGLIGERDVIGESALLCERPRIASVTAKTEVVALRVNRDCYMRLVADCPHSTAQTIRLLGERMNATLC